MESSFCFVSPLVIDASGKYVCTRRELMTKFYYHLFPLCIKLELYIWTIMKLGLAQNHPLALQPHHHFTRIADMTRGRAR